MKTNIIWTEIQALNYCQDQNAEIKFWPAANKKPKYVEVSINAWTSIKGANLTEAVNRLIEYQKTIPADRDNLSWFAGQNDY